MPDDGDLTLKAGGQVIEGWTSVRVTAGIERCPRDFAVSMTARYPGELETVTVAPGDPCEVRIGGDLVVTGYIDRLLPTLEAGEHTIQVVGRGKCEDMVDCSAEWPSNQISNSSILSIAQKLAAPYGISVEGIGDMGNPVPRFNVIWGETAYDVIERVARYEALLVYESPSGSLVLSRVGSASHASGFTEGQNVQRAAPIFAADQRYSEYVARMLDFSLADIAGVGDIIETVVDKGIKRHRLLYVIAEGGDTANYAITRQRAEWEAARRAGRSFNVTVTVDSWRDSAGKLWTPNQFAPVDLPTVKVAKQNWVIGEVSYIRDERGTRADVTLMPPEAFQPAPFLLVPFLRGVDTPDAGP